MAKREFQQAHIMSADEGVLGEVTQSTNNNDSRNHVSVGKESIVGFGNGHKPVNLGTFGSAVILPKATINESGNPNWDSGKFSAHYRKIN